MWEFLPQQNCGRWMRLCRNDSMENPSVLTFRPRECAIDIASPPARFLPRLMARVLALPRNGYNPEPEQ
jgi:hypothetical protein